MNKKVIIGVFDLTDCEGCELELINLSEKIAKFYEQTSIFNWRLASANKYTGTYDVTFIEGSPITETDIEVVKQARASSKIVVTLGSCADFGGLQAYLSQAEWEQGLSEVYGKDYKTKNKAPKPVSYYIDVDYHLPGCPVSLSEIEKFLTSFLLGKKPNSVRYPVCLECKARENTCLLLEGEPCLGPVTKGGCEAICPSRGLRCWGCFGALDGGNQNALKNFFDQNFGKDRSKQLLKTFMKNQDEFRELYPNDEKKEAVK